MLEKSHPGAGATGIACGVVRNNYFQPAMSELMQACVEVWESDPEAYHYNGVGYIALGPQVQESDLDGRLRAPPADRLPLRALLGEAEVDAHMKELFPDWRAQGVTVCLHEHQGGFAFNIESVMGLADKCAPEGVQIHSHAEVTGFEFGDDDTVTAVETEPGPDRGRRAGRDRPRPLGAALLGACSGCRRRSTSTRRRATSCATSPDGVWISIVIGTEHARTRLARGPGAITTCSPTRTGPVSVSTAVALSHQPGHQGRSRHWE